MYDIFSEFEDFFNSFDVFPAYREVKSCPNCGHTYQSFQKSGRFGCGKCYETFREPVKSSLRQIHQNSKHTGKVPSSSAHELKLRKRYEELKLALSEAVKTEDYETAAKLHKELKALGNIE